MKTGMPISSSFASVETLRQFIDLRVMAHLDSRFIMK